MYLAFNLKNIEKQLLIEYKDKFPPKKYENKKRGKSENYMEFIIPGNICQTLPPPRSEDKVLRKIVGILFADPNVAIAKSDLVPHLDYLYHLTDDHLDIYCAGYNAHLNTEIEYHDNSDVVTSVNGTPWKFSTKSFIQTEREIEAISKWKKSDGCTLLLFNVEISRNKVQYNFENCLDWNLKLMFGVRSLNWNQCG